MQYIFLLMKTCAETREPFRDLDVEKQLMKSFSTNGFLLDLAGVGGGSARRAELSGVRNPLASHRAGGPALLRFSDPLVDRRAYGRQSDRKDWFGQCKSTPSNISNNRHRHIMQGLKDVGHR